MRATKQEQRPERSRNLVVLDTYHLQQMYRLRIALGRCLHFTTGAAMGAFVTWIWLTRL
jgi:hypothetical protein